MISFHPLSLAGPIVMGFGISGLVLGLAACRGGEWGLLTRSAETDAPPLGRERLWVHLVVCGAWSLAFGFIVGLGPASVPWDLRLPGEAHWPVWPLSEIIYISGYPTPLVIAWIPRTRANLQRVAWNLVLLTSSSIILFLFVPIAAPPRSFVVQSTIGKLLAWETGRVDFAAASFPSFHTLWAILLASTFSGRGPTLRRVIWLWPLLMSFACVANGAHSIVDVAASWILYALVARCPVPSQWRKMRQRRLSSNLPATSTHSAD